MSRAQQGDVNTTAAGENSTYNTNAQKAFTDTQGDVNSYADAVGAFKAANPYTQGGVVQTADNQQTADTAAGMAESAGQALQSTAVRGGQNAGADIAATQQMEEANERNLVGQEAQQNLSRAAGDTSYSETGLQGTQNVATMQDTLAQQQGNLAQGALNTQEQSAQTPSFMDELGNGIIQSGVGFASGYGKSVCWIAAELYGGWDDWRTARVRAWLTGPFSATWYGVPLMWAYRRWGQRVARAIQTRRGLRAVCRFVFDKALGKAVQHGR
jgi:hypothetical protein